MLFSCVLFLTVYKVWNSPKMFSPQMLLPVWELCCYYDVLPICTNDTRVLYWERLGTCFLILGLPCMSWVNSLFCAFPISSCRTTAYPVLHTGRHSYTCELLSAFLTQYPYHTVTSIKIVLLSMPLTMSVHKSTITNLTKSFLPF